MLEGNGIIYNISISISINYIKSVDAYIYRALVCSVLKKQRVTI